MVDVKTAQADRKEALRLTWREYLHRFLSDWRARFYLVLASVATIAALWVYGLTLQGLFGIVAVIVVYPFVEYAIHRLVFHNQLLFRTEQTAGIWRMLHYYHHLEPSDPSEIFGPPHFMIATMMTACLPLGWLVGGPAGLAAAAVTGLWILPVYEYLHGGVHLVTEPVSAYGKMLRRMHMFHHYHSERGNYGVTSPIADIVLGTYYTDGSRFGRSATVRNLGYDADAAKRYPWIADRPKD